MNDITPAHIVVAVRALAVGGAWVGDIVHGPPELQGKKAFVREVISGEEVEAEVIRQEHSFVVAAPRNVRRVSLHRVAPPCSVFGRCGGCDLQHVDLAAQRREKLKMVETMLLRHAKLAPRDGVTLASAELPGYGYRRRIALHVDREGKIGFFAEGSGTVIPIAACPLARDSVNAAFARHREPVAAHCAEVAGWSIDDAGGRVFHVLALREGIDVERAVERLGAALRDIEHLKIADMGKVVFRRGEDFPSGHFSQVNDAGNELLRSAVLERVTGESALDLYAGAGNFAFPLAERGCRVVAVEADPELVRFGRAEAEARGLRDRVEYVQSSCERFMKGKRTLPPSVVLDPPRSGAKGVVELFQDRGVEEVIYVSCNLPTLTRDLAALAARGYELESVLLVDMFPQTFHVETVSLLRRSAPDAA